LVNQSTQKLDFFSFFFFSAFCSLFLPCSGEADEDCELEVRVDSRINRVYTVFGKSAVDGYTFGVTDRATPVPAQPDRWSIPCEFAGQYVFGVSVQDSAPSLGRLDSLSVARKLGSNYHVVPIRKRKTAQFVIAENSWVVLHVTLDTLATPWFDVDLSASSKLDSVKAYWSRGDVTRDANRTEIALDATLDGMARDLDAGTYQFGFTSTSAVAGSFTRFRLAFDLNNEASTASEFPLVQCPSELCSAPDLQSCRRCTEGSCSWCPETRKCQNFEAQCGATFVTEVKTCPNVAEKCAPLDCAACAADRDCVFCERSALAGGSYCSAGKNDLAAECPTGIVDAKEIKSVDQCPEVVKENADAADRLCAAKPSCTACAEDATCTYCVAKVGNDRCTASKDCDTGIFTSAVKGADQCPDVKACGVHTKCITCAVDPECGWCGETNKCQPKVNDCRAPGNITVVPAVTNSTLCPRVCVGDACDCTKYKGCTACTQLPHCIFCVALDKSASTCIDAKGSPLCPALLDRTKAQCEDCPEYPDPFCPRNAADRVPLSLVAAAVAVVLAALK
jgi:hypothetical protein